ncbi:hypothetical protein [Streptomyces sp. NPDC052225]|uniref:hypothetical protein n=1 Tax=Streptomyces sp. NPDC052225 TaxID=3154949 RepID=UPI00342773AF
MLASSAAGDDGPVTGRPGGFIPLGCGCGVLEEDEGGVLAGGVVVDEDGVAEGLTGGVADSEEAGADAEDDVDGVGVTDGVSSMPYPVSP